MLTTESETPSFRLNYGRNSLNYGNPHYPPVDREGLAGTKDSPIGDSYGFRPLPGTDSLCSSFRKTQEDVEKLLHSHHRERLYSPMSAEKPVMLTADPMVNILAAFYLIPSGYQDELFDDFRGAADAHDLRRLLDTISDWAATAQLYACPTLANDLQEAIAGRKGVADWLPG